MRLQRRYLRGKSKRHGRGLWGSLWCCWGLCCDYVGQGGGGGGGGGGAGRGRGRWIRGAWLLLLAALIAIYSMWTMLLLVSGSSPLQLLLPGVDPVVEGDYPQLLLARREQRSGVEPAGLWDNPQVQKWKQCVLPGPHDPERPRRSVGYLQIFLDGGLNQQRIGICNAVAVAKILNATLLIPQFQINPVWLDSSKFEDIFDVEYFMRSLKKDVRIVRALPPKLAWSTREFYASGEHENRVKLAPVHAPASWYLDNVLPKFQKHRVVVIAPFTHRLSFAGLPLHIQRLRCRVNFQALRFVPAIERLGQALVARLRDPEHVHERRGILYEEGQSKADMVEYAQRQGHPATQDSSSGPGAGAGAGAGERAGLGTREGVGAKAGTGAGAGSRSLQSAEGEEGDDEDGHRGAEGTERMLLGEAGAEDHEQAEEKKDGAQDGARSAKQARFVALHLRFDTDMVAHSACDYGETEADKEALAKYREYAWLGRVNKLRFSSAELRRLGKCPLTPEEAGLFLAAFGFSPSTRLYIATYQVYGGAKRMRPLRELFPFMEDKTSLASREELAPVLGKASRLAALDYYVSLHSDVFVSAAAGNMHNVMLGQRAFFGGKKTVNVNMTLMAMLLHPYSAAYIDGAGMGVGAGADRGRRAGQGRQARARARAWEEVSGAVQRGHRSRVGRIKLRKEEQSIYTYPAPECLCPEGTEQRQ